MALAVQSAPAVGEHVRLVGFGDLVDALPGEVATGVARRRSAVLAAQAEAALVATYPDAGLQIAAGLGTKVAKGEMTWG